MSDLKKTLKKLLMWYVLLNKRLLKKPGFVVILLLIPILVGALGIAAGGDTGIVSVALACENNDDPLAKKITEELLSSSKLIRFTVCDTKEQAVELVFQGRSDAAWVFPDNMEKQVKLFAGDLTEKYSIVEVYEREDTVALLLSHEKLFGAVYGSCSEAFYLDYVRENVQGAEKLTDKEILKYYDETIPDGDLFEFTSLEGAVGNSDVDEANYMTTPVRGLLAVLVVLCGLATALFYMQDNQNGLFSWVSIRQRPLVAFGYQFTSVITVGLIVLLSLFVIDVNVSVGRELLSMLLYVIITTEFCLVVRLLCRNIKILGTLMPVIVIGLIIVCPVFLDIPDLLPLQRLLPPFYYINAAYNSRFLLNMVLYLVGGGALYVILTKVFREA